MREKERDGGREREIGSREREGEGVRLSERGREGKKRVRKREREEKVFSDMSKWNEEVVLAAAQRIFHFLIIMKGFS